MGYNTYFSGEFDLDKKLDDDTFKILKGLAGTRRMKRDMSKLFPDVPSDELLTKYGTDGEFYFDGDGYFGQDTDASVANCNEPPSTQPGLWCQWIPSDDRLHIEWDQGEKFYKYVEWIKYIIDRILAPRGYVLNGEVYWSGEEDYDRGILIVRDNEVFVREGEIVYGDMIKVV